MKNYSKEELQEMKYNDVIKVAKEIGVEFKLQKKAELIDLILEKQGGASSIEKSAVKEQVAKLIDLTKNLLLEKQGGASSIEKEKVVKLKEEQSIEESAEESESSTKEESAKSDEKEKKEKKKQDVINALKPEQKKIFEDDTISKSEKMRRLFKKGLSIAEISHLMEAHYSFVFGVISRYKKVIDFSDKGETAEKTAEESAEQKEEESSENAEESASEEK